MKSFMRSLLKGLALFVNGSGPIRDPRFIDRFCGSKSLSSLLKKTRYW